MTKHRLEQEVERLELVVSRRQVKVADARQEADRILQRREARLSSAVFELEKARARLEAAV